MIENDTLISEFAFMGIDKLEDDIILKCNLKKLCKVFSLYFYNSLNLDRYRNLCYLWNRRRKNRRRMDCIFANELRWQSQTHLGHSRADGDETVEQETRKGQW